MLTSSIKTLLVGGQAAAMAALLAGTAMAQDAVVTPEGNVAVVPQAAQEATSSAESDYPLLQSFDNDQVVAETLVAQGFTGIVISRAGPIMTVTAQRDGVPVELVYSTANGRLMSVDGVELPFGDGEDDSSTDSGSAADLAPAAGEGADAAEGAPGDATDPDAGEGTEVGDGEGADEADDGATGEGGEPEGADGEGEGEGEASNG